MVCMQLTNLGEQSVPEAHARTQRSGSIEHHCDIPAKDGGHQPSVSAIVSDDGLAQVLIDGVAHPVSGATVSASRENVVRFIAARVASELGYAIRVEVADPEGQLTLMIHPDATVQVLPPQAAPQELHGPEAPSSQLTPEGSQHDVGNRLSSPESGRPDSASLAPSSLAPDSPDSDSPDAQRQHSRRADRRRAAESAPEVPGVLSNRGVSGEYAPRDATTEEFAAVVDPAVSDDPAPVETAVITDASTGHSNAVLSAPAPTIDLPQDVTPDASLIEHSDDAAQLGVTHPAGTPARTRPASSLALSALEPLAAPRPVGTPEIQAAIPSTPLPTTPLPSTPLPESTVTTLPPSTKVPPSETVARMPPESQTSRTATSGAASATADSPVDLFTHPSTSQDCEVGDHESAGAGTAPPDIVSASNVDQRPHSRRPIFQPPGNSGPPVDQRSFPLGFSPVPEPDAAAFPVAANVFPNASSLRPEPLLTPNQNQPSTPFVLPGQPRVGHHAAPTAAAATPATPAPAPVTTSASAPTPASAPVPTSAPIAPPAAPESPESLPTLDSLLAGRPVSVGGPAQMGWQATVRRITGGIISPKAGPTEVTHRKDVASVQRSLRGPRTVVVVNPKGGAHKTTATLLIAATFGIHRGGYTLAWDNNETRGTLGWRAAQTRHSNTAVDLLRDLERFEDARSARVGDLDNYVRTQGNAQFDVLASDEDAASAASIDGDAFLALHSSLSRFYRILVVDTGNNMRASNWQAAVNKADQLVIVSTIREDTAQSAAWLLDGLRASGQEEAVANAVTVLSAPDKSSDRELSARLHTHFGKLTRAVLDVPHDPALVAGGPVNVETLAEATRESWLHVTAAVAEGL